MGRVFDKEKGEFDDTKGSCDYCGVILPIDDGCNFFWNDKENKWACEKCAENVDK